MKGVILCHGWASHPSFWDTLRQHFKDVPCLVWNLGYFSPINCPLPKESELSEWVGIGHSLGFLKLLQASLPLAAFIGIQGFTNFLGHNPALQRIRRKELNTIIALFETHPEEVVASFRRNCQFPPYGPTGHMDKDRLLSDLKLLATDYSDIMPSSPSLILGSKKDTVTPPQLLRDNFDSDHQATVVFMEAPGHNLGFQDSASAYRHIKSFVQNNLRGIG